MPTDPVPLCARRQEWIAIVNAGDVNRYLSLLTEDCVWLPPGLPALTAKPAIGAWLKPFFDRFRYEFSITDIGLRIAGDWAIECALFESKMTPRCGGVPISHGGTYVVLWRKEPDGNWYVERYADATGTIHGHSCNTFHEF